MAQDFLDAVDALRAFLDAKRARLPALGYRGAYKHLKRMKESDDIRAPAARASL